MPMTDEPIRIRRGDLQGLALATYIPRRGRGARHYQDTFSCALWLAKLNVRLPDDGANAGEVYGSQWAHLLARLVPSDATIVSYPPKGRKRQAAGFYLAEHLARTVAADLDLPCIALEWLDSGAESSKAIVHHAGKGRALGRVARCDEDVSGDVVCLVDDLWTTGITGEVCAAALALAGAVGVTVVALAATEDTRDRPAEERERIRERRDRRELRHRDRRRATDRVDGAHVARGGVVRPAGVRSGDVR